MARMTDEEKRHKAVKKAEVALRELELSVSTQADHARISAIRTGMHCLDDEQAATKDALDRARASEARLLEACRRLLRQFADDAVPTPEFHDCQTFAREVIAEAES